MTLDFRVVTFDSDDAQLLNAEVQAEYGRRYGGSGDISPITAEEFAPPHGVFLVGYVDDDPVVSGGWRRGGPAGSTDAEIKRMYVRPAHLRRGHARAMLAELERRAEAAGIRRLVLETGLAQPEALELYRSSGFVSIAPFGHYAEYGDSVHLGKTLVRRVAP